MAKIKKGDNIKMLSGKDRGKRGAVSWVSGQGSKVKVIVDGLNKIKKHQRPRKQGQKGQIISRERPVNISSVQLICKHCGKPTRVGFQGGRGKKERICRKCLAVI